MHECHVILYSAASRKIRLSVFYAVCVKQSLNIRTPTIPTYEHFFTLQPRSRLQVFSPLTSHLTCKQTDTPLSHMKFQNAPYTKIFESSFICGEEFTVALVRTYL